MKRATSALSFFCGVILALAALALHAVAGPFAVSSGGVKETNILSGGSTTIEGASGQGLEVKLYTGDGGAVNANNVILWRAVADNKAYMGWLSGAFGIFDGGAGAHITFPAASGSAISFSGPIRYATGENGTATQGVSKSTGVQIDKSAGQITMNNAALAAGAKVSFVVTNSKVVATDVPSVAVASGGTANAYRANVTAVASGSFTITVENITAGSLSEAPVINFKL